MAILRPDRQRGSEATGGGDLLTDGGKKIIGLTVFSIFILSYTGKVIK